MKAKEIADKKKLPKNVRIKNNLSGKYDAQPLFQDKIEMANHILKTIGLPKA